MKPLLASVVLLGLAALLFAWLVSPAILAAGASAARLSTLSAAPAGCWCGVARERIGTEEVTLDAADRAQELEEKHRETALFAQRSRALRPSPDIFCRCCGEEIEAARRAAVPGTRFCIDCKQEFERGPRP